MIVNYKIILYKRFLITKKDLREIRHRKIVHKIFFRYIPNKYKLDLCKKDNYIDGII